MEDKWVRCSVKLPDEDRMCYITLIDADGIRRMVSWCKYINGKWVFVYYDGVVADVGREHFEGCRVIAWQYITHPLVYEGKE